MAHVLYCINYIKIFFLTEYDEPSYIINLQVVYKSGAVASLCLNGHKQMLINNRQIFTQEIFSICNSDTINVGEVEITKMESTTSAFSVGLSYGYCDHESI
jgi:hypothetical protein